jgi:hypothetical protein
MNLTGFVFGNPLILKFVRSRLRMHQAWAAAIAVVLICACIVWWGVASREPNYDVQLVSLLVLQVLLISIIGTSEVASAVAQARDVGILDFHRISPQRAGAVALGYVLGAPVREWVLLACTLPFFVFCAACSTAGLAGWLALLLVVASSALLHHTLGALVGIMASKPRSAGGAAVVMVLLLHWGGPWVLGVLTVIPTATQVLNDAANLHSLRSTFMGASVPEPLLSLIHQLPVLLFLLLALVRKTRLDVATVLSRPQALAAQAVVSVLALADAWKLPGLDGSESGLSEGSVLAALGASVGAGLLLIAATTPRAGELAKGVRRSLKLGRAGIAPFDDRAPNRAMVLAMAAVVLVVGLIAVAGHPSSKPAALDQFLAGGTAILTSVLCALVLVHFGSALQFFQLRNGKTGTSQFALYLFVLWVMPIPIAALVGLSSSGKVAWAAIMQFSHPAAAMWPLAGAMGAEPATWAIGLGAVVNILLTLLWAILSLGAEDRVMNAARVEGPAKARVEGEA